MDPLNNDNIIAEITPAGRGGVSAIRISGPNIKEAASSFFGLDLKKERHAYYVSHEIDEFVVIYYKAPKSYTGEDVCEVFCHANPALVDDIINSFIIKSPFKLRMAEPGEFTKRAYLNGKMDLVQAESVIDVINASSAAMAKQKNRLLKGEFSENIKNIKAALLDLASLCEAHIDFAEDDPGIFDYSTAKQKVSEIDKNICSFIDSCTLVKNVSDAVRVVITGKPNVGKSSIFNKLVEYERAIVHHAPGTTRDYIEEDFIFNGIEVCFVDTAGIRTDPGSEVEKEGIRRVLEIISTASIIVEVSDDSCFTHDGDNTIRVHNKIDLFSGSSIAKKEEGVFYVSALNGEGVKELKKAVLKMVKQKSKMDIQNMHRFSVNTRQISYLSELKMSIHNLSKGFLDNEPIDAISFLLRQAIGVINKVLGDGPVNEDILNSVFSKFCIGK